MGENLHRLQGFDVSLNLPDSKCLDDDGRLKRTGILLTLCLFWVQNFTLMIDMGSESLATTTRDVCVVYMSFSLFSDYIRVCKRKTVLFVINLRLLTWIFFFPTMFILQDLKQLDPYRLWTITNEISSGYIFAVSFVVGTVWTASAHIITAVIGSGVLSLAWATAQLGWIAGPSVMFLFSFVTYYTSTLLAACYRSGNPDSGKRNYTYMDAVRANLGNVKDAEKFLSLRLIIYHIIGH